MGKKYGRRRNEDKKYGRIMVRKKKARDDVITTFFPRLNLSMRRKSRRGMLRFFHGLFELIQESNWDSTMKYVTVT
jgi:hypothetical protein